MRQVKFVLRQIHCRAVTEVKGVFLEPLQRENIRLAATVMIVRDKPASSGFGIEVFMMKRPGKGDFPDLHVFPGGKVEPGERPREALVREIQEELGLSLAPHAVQPVAFAEEDKTGSAKPIVIMLYSSAWVGSPVAALEGGEIAWFRPHEIDLLPKPPLDIELSRRLFEKG